jgi:hypothetical protein
MEHSTKMTLVPTTEAELTQLSELDSELTNILKNKELNQDDKIKLYTNVLGKYKKFEEKVYPNENFNPDNQDNFKTPTKQKLFPKNVLLKKKIGKPVLLYTGSDNPTKKTIKKGSFKKIIDKTIESKPIKWSKY